MSIMVYEFVMVCLSFPSHGHVVGANVYCMHRVQLWERETGCIPNILGLPMDIPIGKPLRLSLFSVFIWCRLFIYFI